MRSLEDQVRVLLEGTGLLRRPERTIVRVRGADRVTYLNRMVSQDLSRLAAGRAALALVLDPQARVLGDPLVWDLGDEVILDLHADAATTALPALERYVLAADVVFEDGRDAYARLALVGPEAPSAAASVGVPEQALGQHDTLQVAGAACRVLRFDREGAPAYEWLVPAAAETAVRRFLVEALPVMEVGAEAFDVWRVAHRVPAWGTELGPEVMALEARLEEVAVSFTKGCYPGQEPVSKAHHLGHPPNLLVRLALAGAEAAVAGQSLLEGGRPAGRLTTVGRHPASGEITALGYVRHALAVPGRVLDLESGASVTVLDG